MKTTPHKDRSPASTASIGFSGTAVSKRGLRSPRRLIAKKRWVPLEKASLMASRKDRVSDGHSPTSPPDENRNALDCLQFPELGD
jgi:hypothetical protein